MTQFAVFAALLLAAVAAFLLPPLWRKQQPAVGDTRRASANLAIIRDQLAELEREKSAGTLAEADYTQARSELQSRLLAEALAEEGDAPATADAATPPSGRTSALALMVLVPALALGGYTLLGNPQALRQNGGEARKMDAARIEGVVAKLAERLEANPEDLQGWLMLARSYKAMGRPADAAAAYARAESAVVQDAGLLADYAEVLATANGNSLQGKPRQLIAQALRLDGGNPHVLLLAGASAMETGDRKQALGYWEKLLPLVEPGSDAEAALRSSIEKLRQEK